MTQEAPRGLPFSERRLDGVTVGEFMRSEKLESPEHPSYPAELHFESFVALATSRGHYALVGKDDDMATIIVDGEERFSGNYGDFATHYMNDDLSKIVIGFRDGKGPRQSGIIILKQGEEAVCLGDAKSPCSYLGYLKDSDRVIVGEWGGKRKGTCIRSFHIDDLSFDGRVSVDETFRGVSIVAANADLSKILWLGREDEFENERLFMNGQQLARGQHIRYFAYNEDLSRVFSLSTGRKELKMQVNAQVIFQSKDYNGVDFHRVNSDVTAGLMVLGRKDQRAQAVSFTCDPEGSCAIEISEPFDRLFNSGDTGDYTWLKIERDGVYRELIFPASLK